LDAAILAAGLRRLTTDGYLTFSVDAVARTAGCPRSTIYARWPGRLPLLDAVLARHWSRRVRSAAVLGDDLTQVLREDLEFAATAEGRAVSQVLLADHADGSPGATELRRRFAERRDEYLRLLSRVDGDPQAVERTADTALAIVWGRSILSAVEPAGDAAGAAARIASLVVSLLGAGDGGPAGRH
jgi:AcrR family transcriptional regulator